MSIYVILLGGKMHKSLRFYRGKSQLFDQTKIMEAFLFDFFVWPDTKSLYSIVSFDADTILKFRFIANNCTVIQTRGYPV